MSIPFQHGRIQIGFFNKVLHEAENWKGNRYVINFNLKKDVYNHFQIFGSEFYDKYKNDNFPKKWIGHDKMI